MDTRSPSPDDAAQDGTPAPAPGLISSVEALWDDLRGIAHDHLRLATLEARRAVQSLFSIAVYGIVIGMLMAAAWLAAAGAMVLWLIDGGFGASAALLLGAALNLLGAVGFTLLVRRKSLLLRFPATVRRLQSADAPAAKPTAAAGDVDARAESASHP